MEAVYITIEKAWIEDTQLYKVKIDHKGKITTMELSDCFEYDDVMRFCLMVVKAQDSLTNCQSAD